MMDTRDLLIHVNYTAAPIPTREMDWAAHVDGDEERGSCMGATPWEALRGLADRLEDDAEVQARAKCQVCEHSPCLCAFRRSDGGIRAMADVHLKIGRTCIWTGQQSAISALTILACESLLEHS